MPLFVLTTSLSGSVQAATRRGNPPPPNHPPNQTFGHGPLAWFSRPPPPTHIREIALCGWWGGRGGIQRRVSKSFGNPQYNRWKKWGCPCDPKSNLLSSSSVSYPSALASYRCRCHRYIHTITVMMFNASSPSSTSWSSSSSSPSRSQSYYHQSYHHTVF